MTISSPPQDRNEFVPAQPDGFESQSFAEKMVLGLLSKMPEGGLEMERADGSHLYFGKPGGEITARIRITDDDAFFKKCAYYGPVAK
jgi:hypothetical protein